MASKKYNCPKCAKKNFSFDNVKLKGQCFSCGFKGGGKEMLKKLGAKQEFHRPTMSVAGLPSNLGPVTGEGVEYLAGRRITKKFADEVGIKWDGAHLYLPIWTPFSSYGSYVRRSIHKKGYYHDGIPSTPYVLGKRDIKRRDVCYLVEGPFDLLSAGLWGMGFSLLGSNLHPNLESWLRAQGFAKIVLWMDPDPTGFQKADEIAERLNKWVPKLVRCHGWALDPRDPGEYTNVEAVQMTMAAERSGLCMPYRSS